jgi:hypothetical protein
VGQVSKYEQYVFTISTENKDEKSATTEARVFQLQGASNLQDILRGNWADVAGTGQHVVQISNRQIIMMMLIIIKFNSNFING